MWLCLVQHLISPKSWRTFGKTFSRYFQIVRTSLLQLNCFNSLVYSAHQSNHISALQAPINGLLILQRDAVSPLQDTQAAWSRLCRPYVNTSLPWWTIQLRGFVFLWLGRIEGLWPTGFEYFWMVESALSSAS
jgi:hypothetical protein